jgi:HSP20 family protein
MTYRIAFRSPVASVPSVLRPRALQAELDRAIDAWFGPRTESAAAADWSPRTDVVEHDTGWTLQLDLPGVSPDSVEVVAEAQELRVRGERAALAAPEGATWRLRERRSGRFERRFRLPESADAEQLTAEMAHGVLTLRIGKAQPAQPRRVSITSVGT